MPLSDRLAFVHVPKTGGLSIAALMGLDAYRPDVGALTGLVDGVQLTHLTAMELRERLGPAESRRRTWFAVVRNPWERLVSEYAYRAQQGAWPYLPGNPTFREFVRFMATADPRGHQDLGGRRHLLTQYEFLYDTQGRLLVDRVFHFRELATVGPALFGRATPHENASDHAPWWTYYDTATEDVVADRYRLDALISHAQRPFCFQTAE